MENEELKKYLSSDEVFKAINKYFVTLKNDDVEKINKFLLEVIETLVEHMKTKDPLFKKLYSKPIFCGSFYKQTKIEKPDEFDINIILNLPINNYIKFHSKLPGFVQINIDPMMCDTTKFTDVEKRLFYKLISNDNLNPNKFRNWVEGIIDKVIYTLPEKNKLLIENTFHNYMVKIKVKKSGPAFTLILDIPYIEEEIHVDLAPALVFNTSMIAKFTTRYHDLIHCKNNEWFAVPVPITNTDTTLNKHWRLSFSLQENEILKKCGSIKPVIRQMKKLRNTQNWKCIASYYIETLFLNKYEELQNLDSLPLTLFFFMMVKELYYACKKHTINYFWNENFNLLGKISKEEMDCITYRLNNIIQNIERNIRNDEFILASYILQPHELEYLKGKFNSTTEDTNSNQTMQLNTITMLGLTAAFASICIYKLWPPQYRRLE